MSSKKDETGTGTGTANDQTQNGGNASFDASAEAAKIIEAAKEEARSILDNTKAECEKIVAEAKAKADQKVQAVASAKAASPAPASKKGDELVSIQLFKDNDKYKDDVFVAVNGDRVQIKRGERVQIKRKFADVLEQSMRQDTATANMIERQSAEYEAKAKALNV